MTLKLLWHFLQQSPELSLKLILYWLARTSKALLVYYSRGWVRSRAAAKVRCTLNTLVLDKLGVLGASSFITPPPPLLLLMSWARAGTLSSFPQQSALPANDHWSLLISQELSCIVHIRETGIGSKMLFWFICSSPFHSPFCGQTYQTGIHWKREHYFSTVISLI